MTENNQQLYVAETDKTIHVKKTLSEALLTQKAVLFVLREPCGITIYTPQSLEEYLSNTAKKVVM